jgi:hypothetical protein
MSWWIEPDETGPPSVHDHRVAMFSSKETAMRFRSTLIHASTAALLIGIVAFVGYSRASQGLRLADPLLSVVRGGDLASQNVNTEVCAADRVELFGGQTAGDCNSGPALPGGTCINCSTQPFLQPWEGMRTEDPTGVDCNIIEMMQGICWRNADFIYTCQDQEVDPDHPMCIGGVYYQNSAQ